MRTLFILALLAVTFGLNYLAEAGSHGRPATSAPQSQELSIESQHRATDSMSPARY
jgi:hypothetical protein